MHPADKGHQRGGNIKVENKPIADFDRIPANITVVNISPEILNVDISYDNGINRGAGSVHIDVGNLDSNYTNVSGLILSPPPEIKPGVPLTIVVEGKDTLISKEISIILTGGSFRYIFVARID